MLMAGRMSFLCRIEKLVHVYDEIADFRVIYGALRLATPCAVSIGIIGKHANYIQVLRIVKNTLVRVFQSTAKNQMQQEMVTP